MKLRSVLLFLFSISIFWSCEKENLKEPIVENTVESRNLLLTSSKDPIKIQEGIVLQNGRLSFRDEEIFEGFMHYLETIEIEDFLATLKIHNYKSFYQYGNTLIDGETIDEPELETVLNQHGALEVESFVIKLNFSQQEVYVIPNTASLFDIYRVEVAEGASNLPEGARVFSFEDEIFGLL